MNFVQQSMIIIPALVQQTLGGHRGPRPFGRLQANRPPRGRRLGGPSPGQYWRNIGEAAGLGRPEIGCLGPSAPVDS